MFTTDFNIPCEHSISFYLRIMLLPRPTFININAADQKLLTARYFPVVLFILNLEILGEVVDMTIIYEGSDVTLTAVICH